ncbi:MAG: LTA synthase family protein [Prevotellaceae bacterium]|jgi:phosphoglycerol transferase MdoB-like AlkP superfamily enzyme|nr:LTA synthase family protein [Prevotellaceae bacterium]
MIKKILQKGFKRVAAEPVGVFLCNFALMLAVYYLCRIFFFLANKSYFTGMTFSHLVELLKGGFQFDISALAYTNAIYMLMQIIPFRFRLNRIYQNTAKWIFVVINSIAVIANCIDVVYFRFASRRTTVTVFTEFQNEGNILTIIGYGIFEYWYVSLFALLLVFVIYKLYRFPGAVEKQKLSFKSRLVYYPAHTLLMCVIIYGAVIGMRGGAGVATRPITLSNANKYVDKGNEAAIVLNTPFCIIRTADKKIYVNPQYFDNEARMSEIYSPLHHPHPQEEFNPLNVVIIIVESFGKEYSGFFNSHLDGGTYRGYTPFLDSLYAESLTFTYSYSNGRKSIDAMPSILSSIPMFIEPFILTPYSTNEISGIADVLKNRGYYSAFFHGAPNGSMGFQAYAKSAGFDDYFGLNEYGNKDLDGMWAVWDEEFLQFYAVKMGELRQPFVTSVFTASSHHPFRIPPRYEGKFPEGTQPIHKCVGYTDYALRRFFSTMSQYEWYGNTLFVLTADHTNQTSHAEYSTDINSYSVPIMFHHPGSGLKKLDTLPMQQIDIMPCILGYLNYDSTYFAFGQDVFSIDSNDRFAVNYNNRLYQFMQNDCFLQFDGQETKSVYNYKSDVFLQHNLAGTVTEKQREMETKLKAIIQQYMSGMIENRLKYVSEN